MCGNPVVTPASLSLKEGTGFKKPIHSVQMIRISISWELISSGFKSSTAPSSSLTLGESSVADIYRALGIQSF